MTAPVKDEEEVMTISCGNGAREFAIAALQKSHSELERVSCASKTHRVAAANLRRHLAKEFPGAAFAVNTTTIGSTRKCLWVQWNDGPTVEQVQVVANLYSERAFGNAGGAQDGFVTAWRAAFGSVETVVAERSYTDAAIKHALASLEMQLGESFSALDATVNKCRDRSMSARSLVLEGMGAVNAMDLVDRVLDNTVWFAPA